MTSDRQKRYCASEGEFDGLKTVVLGDRTQDLNAVVLPEVGSNLISLRRGSTGHDYVYGPPSAAVLREHPTRYGNPVLLPPNRIWEGRFSFAGRSYELPRNRPPHHIHGLVHSLPWKADWGEDEERGAWVRTVMTGREHESFTRVFPQDFSLALTFTLRRGALNLTAEAKNGGPGSFPFCLGYHTYFRLPMEEGEDAGGYRLTLPAGKKWELVDCFPTGRLLSIPEDETLDETEISGLSLDDVFTGLAPGRPWIKALIRHEETGGGIEFRSDRNFPHWVVWNGPEPGSPFVCLEPYTCVTNAPNLDLPRESTGLIELEEGGTWRGGIEFRPLPPQP